MTAKSERLLDRSDAGFTLVETLAAFVVLALVLTMLFDGLSLTPAAGHHAEIMREALRLAQAKLDGLGVTEPLFPGDSSGHFDNGFAWRLQIREVPTLSNAQRAGAWAEITVLQTGDAKRAPPVSLVTFKLAGAPRK
jgi:general secretion pathway protein I